MGVQAVRTSVSDVLVRVDQGVGRITLNRPSALNALTGGMVHAIDSALVRWERDPRVRCVVVDGAGERGLCAGGDIKAIHDDARSGGGASVGFWADEYRMNARIARFPKPFLAVMDGIVMGGGVGVSAHASVRVVTERTVVAMPEVAIGLVPDVGGTYLLSRAPGQAGTHAALTAARLTGADAIHCGLADWFVPRDRLGAVVAAVVDGADPAAAARAASAPPGPSAVAADAGWVDACFAADTVPGILAALDAHGRGAVVDTIRAHSPTALAVTLEALRRAADLPDLESVLEQEHRVSTACLRGPDLVEGIRARVIDKDFAPRWSPARVEDVTAEAVAAHFDRVHPVWTP